MSDVFILDGGRTAIGNFCGSLSKLKAHELGAIVIKGLLERSNVRKTDVSQVIMGQALTAGQGQNPARQASMNAGLDINAIAYCINQLCGSGLKSVVLGCQAIKDKEAEVVICGGQESMSQSPHCVNMRDTSKMGNNTLVDTMIHDGLTDAFHSISMGMTAENVAEQFSISREGQDLFAFNSQAKASVAIKSGYFTPEIIPVTISSKGTETVFSQDEFPKNDTTLEKLSKLRPSFRKEGSVTPGNASGINDGAAAVILASSEYVTANKLSPMAKVVGYAEGGVEPDLMGLGPIPAIHKLLKKIGWTISDVDLFELNEAFASQSIAVIKELKIDTNKVNVHGGAIALGHPIGASGARVLVTLLHALKRTEGRKGVASLCIGGGMGIAMAVEMV